MSDPFLKAIKTWVANSCGLAADSEGRGPVIWGNKAPRPNAPYIQLSLGGDDHEVAQDWMTIKDAANPTPGADLEFTMTGPRAETLVLECFATDELWATVRPERVLRRVLASRRLPTVAQAMRTANIGFGPAGPVQILQLERSSLFEPRARATINLHTISEVSELGTWIETVEVTPTIKEPTGVTTVAGPMFVLPKPDPEP